MRKRWKSLDEAGHTPERDADVKRDPAGFVGRQTPRRVVDFLELADTPAPRDCPVGAFRTSLLLYSGLSASPRRSIRLPGAPGVDPTDATRRPVGVYLS